MSTLKRKALAGGRQRRVRARREPSEELESENSDTPVNKDVPRAEGSDGSESANENDEVCADVHLLMTTANLLLVIV